jgi:hypothetical protein
MKKGILASLLVALMLITVLSAVFTTNAMSISDDTTPPVTTISFEPPEPDGCSGWYISNVTVTLNATDEGSGVNATYYRIDGAEWETYTEPFILSEDGDNILIEYYSVDNAGNIEDVKSATLDIDRTPPEIIIEYNVTKIGCKEWLVEFNFTVTDNTSGSGGGGMDRIEIFINGVSQDVVVGPGPTYTWSFIFKGGLKITVGAGAWDNAGNYGYNETLVKYSRNSIQQSIHPLFLRFLERFPLLNLLLQRLRI